MSREAISQALHIQCHNALTRGIDLVSAHQPKRHGAVQDLLASSLLRVHTDDAAHTLKCARRREDEAVRLERPGPVQAAVRPVGFTQWRQSVGVSVHDLIGQGIHVEG